MKVRDLYCNELNNNQTKYYIFDSKLNNNIDYVKYYWDKKRNNTIKEGSLFIYRRPQSDTKSEFYFYGIGKIERIVAINSINEATIIKGLSLKNKVCQSDLKIEQFIPSALGDEKRRRWDRVFPAYGMKSITKELFIELVGEKEGLEMCKIPLNLLLKGVPGTGKSTKIKEIVDGMNVIKDNILRINVHTGTSNEYLMQGIGVELIKKSNQINYVEKKGLIFKHILQAIAHPSQIFVIILEEIQENSLNELIGDLIFLIENDKRTNQELILEHIKKLTGDKGEINPNEVSKLIKKIISDNSVYSIDLPQLIENEDTSNKLIVPNNLYIFCTSNYREDKKIIEDNLFRRFEVVDMFPDESKIINESIRKFFTELNISIIETFKDYIHLDRFMIGHAIWMGVNDDQGFYRAFYKLVNEFKEIREVEFSIFKEIFEKGIRWGTLGVNENEYKDEVESIRGKKEKNESLNIHECLIDIKEQFSKDKGSNYYELQKYIKDRCKYDF